MSLFLTFYGDDFTGSTDALEQLTLAGIRTMLFIQPPTTAQLKKFPGLQAVGVAGTTRSLAPDAMERELKPALLALKKLKPRHVHYKVCSTFDSSPTIGSIGKVMDVAAKIFPAPFIPLLVAAPALGRYTIFGQHFARYGIGSHGAIHRLDRHPSIGKHPVTPMTEADLRVHLTKQTRKKIALFDILKCSLPEKEFQAAFRRLLAEQPEVVLFDALTAEHLARVGALLESTAKQSSPLFSVGSSGIEAALASAGDVAAGILPAVEPGFQPGGRKRTQQQGATNLPGPQQDSLLDPGGRMSPSTSGKMPDATALLVGSGSCSPVTSGQIAWARKHGFAEVALDAVALTGAAAAKEIARAAMAAAKQMQAGRSVIVHSTKTGSDRRIAAKLKGRTAEVLGSALGTVLRETVKQSSVRRICIAGGDTASYAARALGIEALEMLAPLTPGAPLCRASAPGSPANGCEVVFKGGQVGPENYFEIVRRGRGGVRWAPQIADGLRPPLPNIMKRKKLGLIHTSATLVPVFAQLCKEKLPDVDVFNIVDDSLVKGIREAGSLTATIARRVARYLESAELAGADYLMVTCSSIGPAVEAGAKLMGVPVLRVDQPMADQAVATGRRIGVIATLSTTLEPTADLIQRRAAMAGKRIELTSRLVEGAFEALMAGDGATHDAQVAAALKQLAQRVDVIVLAQASMARVVDSLAAAHKRVPILASPGIAVAYLATVL